MPRQNRQRVDLNLKKIAGVVCCLCLQLSKLGQSLCKSQFTHMQKPFYAFVGEMV
jgi:hypothetical protein